MSGTREGGQTTRDTIYERYGYDYFVRIGALGGKKKTDKKKGFAANRELASRVGRIGGAKSRKTRRVV